jgi:hypothetical protein
MSDRDVFPADVSRNLQQPIPEVKALREALAMESRGGIPYRHLPLHRAARALLAYVENEQHENAGTFRVSDQTWCRKHMFKKRRRGRSGSVDFFCERCEREAMRADPNHVHNFRIYYPGAFGQGVMACNCGENEPRSGGQNG